MNNGEGWSSGGRRGPRGRSNSKETWQIVNRPKSESPVSKLDCRLVYSFSKL